jgi:hypothetical protein
MEGTPHLISKSLQGHIMNKTVLSFILCLVFSSSVEAKTFTVTSLADSGAGSLRQMMIVAGAGDTIEFDPALSGTIQLASALPSILVENLTMTGHPDLSISIDGSSLYRLLDVQSGPFTLSNLNLLNGADALQGGALYLHSGLYADLSQVEVVPASGNAGANPVFVDNEASLDLTEVSFSDSQISQIYLNAGSVNITCQTPAHYVIDGTANGSVYKYGAASLGLTLPMAPLSQPSYTFGVFEGVLEFDGSLMSPCTVYSGGELVGNLTLGGLSNLGKIQPGTTDQLGVIHSSGDFYAVGATTEIKIDPLGNSDQIQVTGNIFLHEGVLHLLPLPGTYAPGLKYSLCLTATGGINGTFGSIVADGLDVTIEYYPKYVQIEVMSSVTVE